MDLPKLLKRKRVEKRQTSSSRPTTPDLRRLNALCRQLRLVQARLQRIEEQNSTLRRDLSRIDKKVYRDSDKQPEVMHAQYENVTSSPGFDPYLIPGGPYE